jgi:hypothetical protein
VYACRRCCHDAAGGCICQRLERDQGAHDCIGPFALERALTGPVAPDRFGRFECRHCIDRFRHARVRRSVGKQKRNGLAGRDVEAGDRLHAFASHRNARTHDRHIGPDDGLQAAVGEPAHPWNRRSVVEPENEFHAHRDASLAADDEAHQIRYRFAHRHEVDHPDGAVGGLEICFEHQRAGAIAPRHDRIVILRCNLPAPVLWGPEQRREAGRGIEPRPAQPVDGTVTRDQCRGLAIADQCIVFDAAGHGLGGANRSGKAFVCQLRRPRQSSLSASLASQRRSTPQRADRSSPNRLVYSASIGHA